MAYRQISAVCLETDINHSNTLRGESVETVHVNVCGTSNNGQYLRGLSSVIAGARQQS
jgi:hypothetical protein